jgi:AcrR family transcriptional regulator
VERDDVLAIAQRQLNEKPTSSMADIATAAGISRATLHRHFSGRDDLLVEIGSRSLDRMEERLAAAHAAEVASSGDPERIRQTIITLLRQYNDDSDDFGFALTDHFVNSDPDLQSRMNQLMEQEVVLFTAGQAAGVLRSDVSPRWLSAAAYGLLVAAREALRNGDVPRRDLSTLVSTFFLDGAAAPGTAR